MRSDGFEFDYPGGLRIGRGLTEDRLVGFGRRVKTERRDMGTGWVWCRLPAVEDGGMRMGFDLGFFRGPLQEIVVFHDDEAVYGKGWEDWSEEKEQERVEATRRWLEWKGYPPGVYRWGQVWVRYDVKSGFGGGWVRYGESET